MGLRRRLRPSGYHDGYMLNAEAPAVALVLDADLVVRTDGPLLREAAAGFEVGYSPRSR